MTELDRSLLLDCLSLALLGFFGSFGHCVGMCGPLSVAFALGASPSKSEDSSARPSARTFHLLLNLGRVLSYAGVGVLLGAVSSTLVAGGQLAGVGSDVRQAIALFTGLLLVAAGLAQIHPDALHLPLLHPIRGALHDRLSRRMSDLSAQQHRWVPLLLGICWGLIPCGFLYAAQLKAAATGHPLTGALSMLAFGLGTAPTMVGVGLSADRLSAGRRSQLFQLGGWLTLAIGLLTLLRTDAMVDRTGHGALLLLMLALAARPLSRWWTAPLRYRRAIGVGAFLLALAHVAHTLDHSLDWNLQAIAFLVPQHRWGLWTGAMALALMVPAALTSSDRAVAALGKLWKSLHRLTVPALGLATAHTLMLGSNYLGELTRQPENWLRSAIVLLLAASVFGLRAIGSGRRSPQPPPVSQASSSCHAPEPDANLNSTDEAAQDCDRSATRS